MSTNVDCMVEMLANDTFKHNFNKKAGYWTCDKPSFFIELKMPPCSLKRLAVLSFAAQVAAKRR